MGNEVYDFNEDGEELKPWDVPEYLANLYAMWTALGNINEQIKYVHHVTHRVTEGYEFEGTRYAPDTLMHAFMDAPSDEVEEMKTDEGRVITAHDLLVTTGAALNLLLKAIAYKLKSMDALPPWWNDTYDPDMDRPLMGFEIREIEEDDE